jgi:hypothetical protein
MNSHLITRLATAHTDDLLRQAENARTVSRQAQGRRPSIAAMARRVTAGVRRPASARQHPEHSADLDLTIRFAVPADDPALRRLAQLDSSCVPTPPLPIAEEDGEARAALSLLSADAIADPFHSTSALVQLLRNASRAGRQGHAAPLRAEVTNSPSHGVIPAGGGLTMTRGRRRPASRQPTRRELGAGDRLRDKHRRPNQIRTSREDSGYSAVPSRSYLPWK